MTSVADDEPPPVDMLRKYATDGRAWVVERVGQPVAYLLADFVDGEVHVEQVSVHPDHAHRRLGRALREHEAARGLDRWSRACMFRGLSSNLERPSSLLGT